mgnify:CR=1 FL=1
MNYFSLFLPIELYNFVAAFRKPQQLLIALQHSTILCFVSTLNILTLERLRALSATTFYAAHESPALTGRHPALTLHLCCKLAGKMAKSRLQFFFCEEM